MRKEGIAMKRIFSLILSIVLSINLAACGAPSTPTTTEPEVIETTAPTDPFDIAGFKETVAACTKKIDNATVILNAVVTYEISFWEALAKLNGSVTAEKVTSKAMEWLAENTDADEAYINTQYDNIAILYKEIIATDISGAEAQEILGVFKEYYDAYIGLYNMAFKPSGTVASFSDKHATYSDELSTASSKLEILLSD